MLDIAVAYNRYKFLGNEFLTWLWFMIETDPNRLRKCDPDMASLNMGSRLVLENMRNNAKETICITGDEASLEEAKEWLEKIKKMEPSLEEKLIEKMQQEYDKVHGAIVE